MICFSQDFSQDKDSAQNNKIVAAKKKKANEESSGELKEKRWSIVSFEKRVAENLTYAEAAKKLKQFEAKNVSGLCLVTNEAAARISD